MKTYFSLADLDVKNRYIIVRVDFNVPIENGKVKDVTRISGALPTISHLLKNNAMVILISHLGRPEGKVDPKFSLKPVLDELKKQLNKEKGIYFLNDCIGSDVQTFIDRMVPGELVLLENLRFYKQEEADDAVFASSLAELADCYVNDAFGASHRAHASIVAITNYLPSAAGLLLERELNELSKILSPKKPFVCLLGGLKISDKIKTIEQLAQKADKILIGGAMAAAFLKAKGLEIGTSKVDAVDVAEKILKRYHEKILLPTDVTVAEKFDKDAKVKTVSADAVPHDWMIVDIGPKTRTLFKQELKEASTIFWNGPSGVYEFPRFAEGTKDIALYLSKLKTTRVVGGGDTTDVVTHLNLQNTFTHVSTGGGAALEFLEGKKLPAIVALERSYLKFKEKV